MREHETGPSIERLVERRVSSLPAALALPSIDHLVRNLLLVVQESWPKSLRVDVQQNPAQLQDELDEIYSRMARPGDILHGLPAIGVDYPGFVFRYREADGEHYIYVEDPASGRLAGYTVFNRLVEISRRADRYLRAPHSKYAAGYQRRGLATAVYRWWLDAGNCMISGARQSAGANALWRALARSYPLAYVEVRAKKLRFLGLQVDPRTQEDLHTRMVLAGAGWDLPRLQTCLDMRTR